MSLATRQRAALVVLAALSAWVFGATSGCGPGGGGGSGGTAGQAGAAGASGSGGDAASPDATSDGPVVDGAAGAPADGAAGASGSGGDASLDGASDGSAGSDAGDAGADGPVSQFCGDGIRDPISEECDDATGLTPQDACSADCRVQDVLLVPGPGSDGGIPPKVSRRVGLGRHPVAANDSGYGVAFVETQQTPARVGLRAFGAQGVPGATVTVADDASTIDTANPVVAALPGGKLAVAWTDLNADGSGLGIALRTFDPATSQLGALVRVNTTTTGSQRDVDLIWTGSELVAAWVDDSKLPAAGSDIIARALSANGAPISDEQPLAASTKSESKIALAPFGASFAGAWRVASPTAETIEARAGNTSWTVAAGMPAASDDGPALVALDSTHLLLVFSHDGATTSKVSAAVLDSASPGSTASFDITPLVAPYSTDSTLGQSQPNVARVGDRVFVSWRSDAVLADVNAEDLWLKEISWSSSGGSITLDLSKPEIALPRWSAHLKDDQRYPGLAATPLLPGGALVAAWDDYGRGFGSVEGTPDVVSELIPIPLVRLQSDGGAGQ
ncbi:MAG: hypothetical protein KC776_09180 [Myxococcales bacterium]|nr:hypothetical protein [Myxococcales bacterium]